MGKGAPVYPPGPHIVGNAIETATPTVDSPIHHVASTVTITTISNPPGVEHFYGPVYLVADSVFAWTTSGNIGAAPGTTLVAGRAYGFVYDKATGKWYPFGEDS